MVFDDGTKIVQEGLEAVDRQVVFGSLGFGLRLSLGGALGWPDNGFPLRVCRGFLGIEENRSQSLAHVPLDVVREQTQENVRPDPIGEPVVNRTHL